MKAIMLRFEPLLVFAVVIALALWELVSLYRRDRRRNRPPPAGPASSVTPLEREPNA